MADAVKDPFTALNDMKGSFTASPYVSKAPFSTPPRDQPRKTSETDR